MKYLVRAIGILAIIAALYIMVGEQIVGSSGSAYVNTQLAPVRAPISGQTDMSGLSVGVSISAGQNLGAISARQNQTDRTLDYRRELEIARAERDAAMELGDEGDGDIASDRPYQRAMLDARVATLESLLETQQAAQSSAVSSSIAAPATGLVWAVPANVAGHVEQGDTLAWIAQCDRSFIHASVDERLYNRLSSGDEAQFRTSDGDVLQATVTLLGGTGPRALMETLAIVPSARQSEGFSVLLTAPQLRTGSCELGKTGRVIFSRGPLAIIEDWRARIGL